MPNGVNWRLPTGAEYHNPIIEIGPIFKIFAKNNKFKIYTSDYHEGLYCEVYKEEKSKFSDKILIKKIYLILCKEEPLRLEFGLEVRVAYKIKNVLIALFRGAKQKARKNLQWKKVIDYLSLPIDLARVTFLLEEGKKILDNFDESDLKSES